MPDISSRPTSRNGWTLPEAVTSARLLGIVASSRVSRQILNSRASSVPPGAPPRRPPYFGPSRAARVPRVASEGIVAMIVDAHGCTSARWYRGTTCCRGRSSAPPGSLAPSPWGRASGSLQGRVRPCSCSPPLVTSSSILKVSARSPSEPCEIYSRLITMSGRARARVRCGSREQRERDRADELEHFYHKSQQLGSAHSIFGKAQEARRQSHRQSCVRSNRVRNGLTAGGNWIRTSRTGCDESGFRSFCVAPDVCSRDMGMPQEATAIVDWPQSSWCSDAALSPQPKMSDEANFRASAIAAPLRASAWSENRVRKERSPKTPLLALAPCRLIGWPSPTLRRLP